MKKLTILLITIFSIYLIYNLFKIDKVNYVSITDVNNINNYINKDKITNYSIFISSSILESYQDIKKNKTIQIDEEIVYLKKVLRESDILVISVGMRELANNFNKYEIQDNYLFFNKMYENINKLITEIKKYAYCKIVFLGYYNPTNYYDANIDRLFYDINTRLDQLMTNNNIIYINLYELIKGNDYKMDDSYNLNSDGNKKLMSIINLYL